MVSNGGDARLEVGDVRIVGTHFADFEITRETCTDDSFQVGDGCGIAVTFTPNAGGARSASLRISDNAPGSHHSVPLTGSGVVPTCAGQEATIVGTAGADVLFGTPGNDIVALLAGDDSFRGDLGNDTVCGASGDDELNGQGGVDTLRGGAGDDQLRGEANNDALYGGSDDDDLFGGGGAADACYGGSGTNTLDTCELP